MPAGPDVSSFYAGMSLILPEILLSVGVVVLLVLEAFAKGDGLGKRAAHGAIAVLALTLVASILVSPPEGRSLFSGMIVVDPFATFFRVLSCVAGILGALIALRSTELGTRRAGEYYSMYLALVLGMILMAEASDLVMIYIAIELVSMMSYVMAGFRRRDRKSAEAALKYVIYGGAASGVMLFGFSFVYGLTGHTQLSMINLRVAELVREVHRTGLFEKGATIPLALTAGILFSFAGFAYKIAAVPLHMWSPDVYEGAPTPFTAFLSTGPKAAGFAGLIRFFVVGFADARHYGEGNLLAEVTTLPWPQLLIVVSLLTMTLGNLAAIGQSNIKRFLAYSSIAHAGYSLIGIASFSRTGASSVLLYMTFYLAMNIGAFLGVIWVREKTGSERIDEYKGLGYRAPWMCVGLAVCLFSLTGLPPLAGFIGKFYLFAAVIDRGAAYPIAEACLPAARAAMGFGGKLSCALTGGGIFYFLAVVGVLNSAISLYYYARVVRNMFLVRPDDETPIHEDAPSLASMWVLCAFLIVGGIYWAPISRATDRAINFTRPTAAQVGPGITPGAPAAARAER